MPNHADKTSLNQSKSVANAVAQQKRKSGDASRFQDILTAATTQQKVAIDSSPSPVIQRDLAGVEDLDNAAKSQNYITERGKFKTAPTKNDDTGGKSAKGRGVSYDDTTNLVTNIEWKTPVKDNDGYKDGVEMTAHPIGPDHNMGSTPGAGEKTHWVNRRKALSAAAGKHKYIAGHLLNHELGGPGNLPENLAAIPDEINKAHNRMIEEPVKKAVNQEGKWGYYQVKITHSTDKSSILYASNLQATWYPLTVKEGSKKSKYYEKASGEKIEVNLPIKSPSELAGMKAKKKTSTSKAKKAEKYIIDEKSALTVTKQKGDAPVVRLPGFDQLVLVVDAFYLANVTRPNVILIKELQEKNEDASNEINDLKNLINSYTEDKKKLEERIDNLEGQIEEMEEEFEIEDYKRDQERQIEKALNENLQKQVEELKEKLEKAQKKGLFFSSLFMGEEVFKELGKEGAFEDFGMEEDAGRDWNQEYEKHQPPPPKSKKRSNKSIKSDYTGHLKKQNFSSGGIKKPGKNSLPSEVKKLIKQHIDNGKNFVPSGVSQESKNTFKRLYINYKNLDLSTYRYSDQVLLKKWGYAPEINFFLF